MPDNIIRLSDDEMNELADVLAWAGGMAFRYRDRIVWDKLRRITERIVAGAPEREERRRSTESSDSEETPGTAL